MIVLRLLIVGGVVRWLLSMGSVVMLLVVVSCWFDCMVSVLLFLVIDLFVRRVLLVVSVVLIDWMLRLFLVRVLVFGVMVIC